MLAKGLLALMLVYIIYGVVIVIATLIVCRFQMYEHKYKRPRVGRTPGLHSIEDYN